MLQFFERFPLTRPLLRWRAHRKFLSASGMNRSWGVYETFDQAMAALPPTIGYNAEGIAQDYISHRIERVFPYDYPVMLWLERAFKEGSTTVYDIGGSVGVHFFSYQRYVVFPKTIHWLISEVPNIVKSGRELCVKQGTQGLAFTDTFEPFAVNADIWMSAGALHHLESVRSLGQLLQTHSHPPKHIILNKLPLYRGKTFVTAQNISHGGFVACYIWGAETFIAEVEAAGYVLKDRWDVPDRRFKLTGDPEHSFDRFSGLYFVRQDIAKAMT